MVRSVFILAAAASLATAQDTQPRRVLNSGKGVIRLLGGAPGGISLATPVECDAGEQVCGPGCIPILGNCCDEVDGGWCDFLDYCDQGGCCEIGEVCSGSPSGCEDGFEDCEDRCMPEGAVCCSGGLTYCDAGETCSSGGCLGGGGGGGGSGGGSDDDDDDDDDSGSGGGGGSGGSCDADQESCGTGCMPLGAVCCSGLGYCDAGFICSANRRCTPEGGSGGGGGGSDDDDDDEPTYTLTSIRPSATSDLGDDDDDDDDFSFTVPSFTLPSLTLPSFTLPPIPTASGPSVGGGDDDDDESDSNSDGSSGGGTGAGYMVTPSLVVMGLLALIPLVL